jgi:hypothetical protein
MVLEVLYMTILETNKLIAFVEKMAAFPKSVQQAVQLTSDINASAKERVVRVNECDPIMTFKTLKAINSSFQISKHLRLGAGGNSEIGFFPESIVARFGLPITASTLV